MRAAKTATIEANPRLAIAHLQMHYHDEFSEIAHQVVKFTRKHKGVLTGELAAQRDELRARLEAVSDRLFNISAYLLIAQSPQPQPAPPACR